MKLEKTDFREKVLILGELGTDTMKYLAFLKFMEDIEDLAARGNTNAAYMLNAFRDVVKAMKSVG